MLTRKHFEAIAQAFAETRGNYENSDCDDVANGVREYLAKEIANICAEENPRFDRERFLKACEVTP